MTSREVELSGGAPWGFRMHGGVDQNQPLRISRVNLGRKASLSGIREGDVISSINGRSTKNMSNGEAHAMLRTAGPILRLGLNEDREMSPRRKSIGKGSIELKRPSQLIAETSSNSGRATPQAPVYATIRPSQSSNRPISSSPRASLNSLPSALVSTNLIKSAAPTTFEEPIRFHPTNPFYSTLPSNNYSCASKLPIPNGKSSYSSLDRSRSMNKNDNAIDEYNEIDNHKNEFLSRINSGPSSLPLEPIYFNKPETYSNGYEYGLREQRERNEFSNNEQNYQNNYNDYSKNNHTMNIEKPEINHPFEGNLRKVANENHKERSRYFPNSQSDGNFNSNNEEITRRSIITEHKVDEIEEVKTIKKVVLNSSNEHVDQSAPKNFEHDFGAPASVNSTETPRAHNTAVNSLIFRSPVTPTFPQSPSTSTASTRRK